MSIIAQQKTLTQGSIRQLFFKLIQSSETETRYNWLDKAKNRIVESVFLSPQKFSARREKDSKQEISEQIEIDSLLSIGEYSGALFKLSKLLTQDNPSLFLKTGRALLGMGKYPEAISVFEMISTIIPDVAIDLAAAHAANSHFSLAHKIVQKFTLANPENPVNLYWHDTPVEKHIERGKSYLDQDFNDVALRCFEAALICDPGNKDALKYREQCYRI